ncbi:MAG: hypothetical protein KGK08_04000 [Acidobacteriota bacterium]|nr:hypothetical protein [Acidobacteriota bacterium]
MVEAVGQAGARAGGTESLVHTLSRCAKRPSLLAIEIGWRWVCGVPTLLLVWRTWQRTLAAHTGGTMDLGRLGLDRALLNDPVGAAAADPLGVSTKVSQALGVLLPDLLHAASWMVPALLALWIVGGALGRTLLLRRMDSSLHARPGALLVLQTVRSAALGASLLVWVACVRWAAAIGVRGPIAAGQEPNLVLYFAVLIVSSLTVFTLWAAISWWFSIAPLLAMLHNAGPWRSLRAALGLKHLKGKLVEVNLVLGIVKIALLVLAMVFSATPLPFQAEITAAFLAQWWAVVTVFYLVGSDYFHVVRLMAYLGLWRATEAGDGSAV